LSTIKGYIVPLPLPFTNTQSQHKHIFLIFRYRVPPSCEGIRHRAKISSRARQNQEPKNTTSGINLHHDESTADLGLLQLIPSHRAANTATYADVNLDVPVQILSDKQLEYYQEMTARVSPQSTVMTKEQTYMRVVIMLTFAAEWCVGEEILRSMFQEYDEVAKILLGGGYGLMAVLSLKDCDEQ
jgi:hypothetical protein